MTNSHPQGGMSLDAPSSNLDGFSKSESCELDEMPLATKKDELDGKCENQQEASLLSSPETSTVSQSQMQGRRKGNCELNLEQIKTLLLKENFSLLKGYKIDKDVKRAVESGNIEEYCKDLVTKLTKLAQTTGVRVAERVIKVKDKAFAVVTEESKRKEQGGGKDGSSGQKSFEEKLKSLPRASRELALQAFASSDPMLYCNCVTNEIHKTVLAIQEQAVKDGEKVAKKVLEAAKALQESAKDDNSKIDEDEMNFETSAAEKDHVNSESNTSSSQTNEDETLCDSEDFEEDLLNSESNTSSSQTDEEETYLETEDIELVRNESNTTSSQTNEDETTIESENDEQDLVSSESDEDSEKPPIRGQDDEHVIPTPPPPPPVKLNDDMVNEIQDNIMEVRKYQVNQLRKELNFAIARLTSEVIKSYEQACILQKHGSPSLEKSALDFIEKQETRKTFYIKEISTRVRQVLRMLSPEQEVNVDLQDLDETVKLLYFLQTSRNYYVDKIAVTTATNAKIGFTFNFLLPLAFFVIVLTLSLNGEWIGLIIFVAVVLICMIKAWQGMFTGKRKKVEVFGRKKKAEKID